MAGRSSAKKVMTSRAFSAAITGSAPVGGLLRRRGDRLGDEAGAEAVEVVAVEVERAVADVVDAAAGEVAVAEDVGGADADQVRAVDGVERGEDRGLAAQVEGVVGGELYRDRRGLAAAGELLGDVPAGFGDRVDEDDAVAAGEEGLDAPDVGGDDGVGAGLGGGGAGAEGGEEVAGGAVGAAFAVVEGVGCHAGDPAGGEDDDIELGARRGRRGCRGRRRRRRGRRRRRCGRGRGSAGRRCG